MVPPFIFILLLYSALQPSSCLHPQTPHSATFTNGFRRKLLQTPPLKVLCILLSFRRLSLRHKDLQLDLTQQQPVDLSQSSCSRDQAMMVMRFGDVLDLKDLSISLDLSSSVVESSGERWFSLDSVLVRFNSSERLVFKSSQVYRPVSASFSCDHISSLHRRRGLLTPTERAHNWALTFTDFQIQAFDSVSGGVFAPALDCAAFVTPAVLMGLVSSLILLLVLVYAFHMLLHLRDLENQDQDQDYSCQNPDRTRTAQKYVL